MFPLSAAVCLLISVCNLVQFSTFLGMVSFQISIVNLIRLTLAWLDLQFTIQFDWFLIQFRNSRSTNLTFIWKIISEEATLLVESSDSNLVRE